MNLLDDDLNLECLDGRKCRICGEVPQTYSFIYFDESWIEVDDETYNEIRRDNFRIMKHNQQVEKHEKEKTIFLKKDRSSRIDCDASTGTNPPKYQVYCFQCWKRAVLS